LNYGGEEGSRGNVFTYFLYFRRAPRFAEGKSWGELTKE